MDNENLKVIYEAIKIFHERFYPEAKAEVVGYGDEKIAILFTGNMCLTCGMSDYFLDFLYILTEVAKKKFGIEDMRELNDMGTAWIVIYAPEEKIKTKTREWRVITFDRKSGKVFRREFRLKKTKLESYVFENPSISPNNPSQVPII